MLAASETFSGLTKGLPPAQGSIPLKAIGSLGWNLLREDVSLPAAVIRYSAMERNRQIMREFLASSSALLCPHVKTTMSPQLFAEQASDGAWGLTVATPQQIRVVRQCGYKRILLANQLVGRSSIRFVVDEMRIDPDFDFYCLVDSVDGVNRLAQTISEYPVDRPLQVLLEIGSAGQRCGCRSQEEALNVAQAVKENAPLLVLRGIEAYEGLFPSHDALSASNEVENFLAFCIAMAKMLERERLFFDDQILLTAGGSSYFDLVAKVFIESNLTTRTKIILRSGCYLIHDSGCYARFEQDRSRRGKEPHRLSSAEAALEIWAYVQSVPEPRLAILNAGKRDCGHDAGMPVPMKWFRPGLHDKPEILGKDYSVVALSDQHAHVQVPSNHGLQLGDLVGLGISHPCTTFDKWKLIFVVDNEYNITSAVETFF